MSAPLTLPPCPEWCRDRERPDHVFRDLVVEEGDAGEVQVTARHDGPVFGPFSGSGEVDIVTGQAWFKVDDDGLSIGLRDWRDPVALVELAQHAAAAAAWLEERQA